MSMKLTISVPDLPSVMSSFDVIRVKRSVDGEEGQYELLTALTPQAASILAGLSENYAVAGKTFELKVDFGDASTVDFVGTAPLDADGVATQINDALGGAVAVDSLGFLELVSPTTGTGSKVKIVGGTALGDLGFTAGDEDYGEDAHIPLQSGMSLYDYTDSSGEGSYYYKAQFYNTATGLSSVDSSPFKGEPGTVVGIENLSIAKVDLIDGRGVALPDQEITFYGMDQQLQVDGFKMTLTRKPITIVTDNSGHAEVSLVRGSKWKVVFEGTSFIREFVVPGTDDFDLLSVLGSAPDPFNVSEPQFPPAIRRTL